MEDLYTVLDTLDHVRIVNFYGGEPLLHPELPFMIRRLAGEDRIDRISVITNGTLVPNSGLIEAMKAEKRFLVRISDYGKISSRLDELKGILNKNKIRYEISNYEYWDRPSTIKKVDETEEELIAKFKDCTAGNVLMILNRKVYLCSTGSSLCNMGVFPDSPDNYVDLSGTSEPIEELQKRILNFVARPGKGHYLDACRYCSGSHCVQFEEKVPVAEQTKELRRFEKLY